MKDLPKLIISIVGCELVGILGTLFTIAAIPTWYATLNKPFFAPPSWIFGPAWTLLYLLMGISFYLIWKVFFLTQLGLNFLWPPIFFGLKTPLLGFIVIVAMWVLIVMTMKKFYTLSAVAYYLLVPYLLWVSFAVVLNGAIVMLN